MRELEQRGAGDPDGRLSHSVRGDDAVHVEGTWETREQFGFAKRYLHIAGEWQEHILFQKIVRGG